MSSIGPKRAALFAAGLLVAGGVRLVAQIERRAVSASPGDSSRVAEVEQRCPTFSWAARRDALTWELVIYELPEVEAPGDDPAPVVRTELPAGVLAWTPSLASCFERGRSYAWALRAKDERGTGEWSELRFFRVAAQPSLAEVEEALELLSDYRRSIEAEVPTAGTAGAPAEAPQVSETSDGLSRPPGPIRSDAAGTGPVASTGMRAQVAATTDGSAGVVGLATGATGFTHGVIGEALSDTGAGVLGIASASAGIDAAGVVGSASATSGLANGVYGRTFSPDGVGVHAANLSGDAFGVDLLLDGDPPTLLTERAMLVGGSTFDLGNFSGDLVLRLEGAALLTELTGGDVTSVAAGSGLAGGGASGDVVVQVANQGIVNAMLAPNSVTGDKILDGTITEGDLADVSVGLNEIITVEVQARIFQSCPPGQAIRSVAEDGTIVCSPEVQARIFQSCAPGQAIRSVAEDGTIVCSPVARSLFTTFGGTGIDDDVVLGSGGNNFCGAEFQFTNLTIPAGAEVVLQGCGFHRIAVQGLCSIHGTLSADGTGETGGSEFPVSCPQTTGSSCVGRDANGIRSSSFVPKVASGSGGGGGGFWEVEAGQGCGGDGGGGAGGGGRGCGSCAVVVQGECIAGADGESPGTNNAPLFVFGVNGDFFEPLLIHAGAGGGGGASLNGGIGGGGGYGGGVIYLECGALDASGGTVTARGLDGADGDGDCAGCDNTTRSGGGGGGGGGVVVIRTRNLIAAPTIDVSGGAGGDGGVHGGAFGGDGAPGYWRIIAVP